MLSGDRVGKWASRLVPFGISGDHLLFGPFSCLNELVYPQVSTHAWTQEVLSETSVPLDPAKKAAYLQPHTMEIQLQDPQHQQDCG